MSEILRLVAGGLLALIACYIGVLIKRRYAKRVTFFKSACEFSSCLATELSLKKTPMPKIASKFLQGREGEFESCVECWINLAKRGGVYAFENANVSILKTDEKKQLASFFSALGKTDLKDQLSHVDTTKIYSSKSRRYARTRAKNLETRTSNCACLPALQ